jgi:hypothetical protein
MRHSEFPRTLEGKKISLVPNFDRSARLMVCSPGTPELVVKTPFQHF